MQCVSNQTQLSAYTAALWDIKCNPCELFHRHGITSQQAVWGKHQAATVGMVTSNIWWRGRGFSPGMHKLNTVIGTNEVSRMSHTINCPMSIILHIFEHYCIKFPSPALRIVPPRPYGRHLPSTSHGVYTPAQIS